MAASSLRRWLRRAPQPAKLRVDGRDVAIASGANMWAVTEETVCALNPSRIEAIDANGVMLRATVLGDRDDDDAGDDKPAAGARTELVELARLIAEAHDAGARRHAEAYALAFQENTRLVQILAARLGGLENAWQKAMQQTAQAQADVLMAQAQQTEDPAGAAVSAMLAQALVHQARPAAAAPKANGAPTKKGDTK